MSWLLDANALIALGWPAHEHHERMLRWFGRHAREGWATSALTQSAFVRVISQPAFSGQAISIGEIAEVLLRNTAHPKHRFLALDFGIEQVLGCCTGGLRGHRQITDAWLLTLAMRHGARLLTFDGGIAQLLATAPERQRHIKIPD
ncbi:TA system VapC family ribonuclease toxin [Variovorax sp. J31P207]|uniref:TA system VapC family ribonuclease toxin n=1 Tax=Variovorax sp. J31P207 TaxID=3053510 RepID=UPI0025755F40|nr:TA system VapC family ribonuclease toxin [Variovorax sp. J31P207]MDM0068707.1 PIN domain-containing protein [Variovorax sp. J31P207]